MASFTRASQSTAAPRWVRPLTGIVALLDGPAELGAEMFLRPRLLQRQHGRVEGALQGVEGSVRDVADGEQAQAHELLLSLLAFLLLVVKSWVDRQWTELVLKSMLATAIDRLNFLSDKKI